MNTLQFTSLFPVDFAFTSLLHEHSLVLIVGVVSLFISGLLRAIKTFSIQAMLLFLFFTIGETFSNPLYLLLVVLQFAFGLWIIWKVKKEIDLTYYRHSEKTLKRPRDITRNGNPGTHHFLF